MQSGGMKNPKKNTRTIHMSFSSYQNMIVSPWSLHQLNGVRNQKVTFNVLTKI